MSKYWSTVELRLRAVLGVRARWVALLGAILTIAGSLGPWATFAGFPGKMSLSGFPGGARIFSFVLAFGVVLLFVRFAGATRAARGAAFAALAIVCWNTFAIAKDGGGAVNLAWGAWVALVGTVLFAIGTSGSPHNTDLPRLGPLPTFRAVAVVALSFLIGLAVVVWGLRIEESSRFVSFLFFLTGLGLVASRLGLTELVSDTTALHTKATALCAAAVVAIFPFTQDGSAYWLRVAASIGIFACAAVGLNIVVGLAGLLDLGYIAFVGTGAYVGALLANAVSTTVHIHLPWIVVVLIGATIASIAGVIIGAPTLRLEGDYLAIVTLAFGEIFRITANNWNGLTRGPNGISGVPDLAIGNYQFSDVHTVAGIKLPGEANYFFVEAILLGLVILAFTRLGASRIGRAWVAIRDDEVAARAMGVNTARLKLLAFAIGAFLAGAAGTLDAHVNHSVTPDSYTFLESILLLSAVVLGGMGSVSGAILGAAALKLIPEKLRFFSDKRLLFFGLVLVLMMRLRPGGLLPHKQRGHRTGVDVDGIPPDEEFARASAASGLGAESPATAMGVL